MAIGAGSAFVPEAFEGDGFRFLRDATPVLIDLFGKEIDGRCSNFLRLLVGSA